jgi:hypothetical protein
MPHAPIQPKPVPRLRRAIDAYRANQKDELDDQETIELLERLAESPKAADFFERLNPQCEMALLNSCIVAGRIGRTFLGRIEEEEAMSSRIEGLKEAVVDLGKFVEESELRPRHCRIPDLGTYTWRMVCDEGGNLTELVQCKPADFLMMKIGLGLIAGLMAGRQHSADRAPAVLGATRKKGDKIAAENAAIWRIAEAVLLFTGKAHWRHVVNLAQVVLQVPALTQDRVKKAVAERDERAIVTRKQISLLFHNGRR